MRVSLHKQNSTQALAAGSWLHSFGVVEFALCCCLVLRSKTCALAGLDVAAYQRVLFYCLHKTRDAHATKICCYKPLNWRKVSCEDVELRSTCCDVARSFVHPCNRQGMINETRYRAPAGYPGTSTGFTAAAGAPRMIGTAAAAAQQFSRTCCPPRNRHGSIGACPQSLHAPVPATAPADSQLAAAAVRV